MTTRRKFLETTAAIIAATRWRMKQLPIGFSTLGCPRWDWLQVLDFAAAHGYAAVELRGLQETMDLTQRPEFATARVPGTKRLLAEHRLVVSCLSSSANMHEMEPAKRAAQLDEARRFIDLAHALGAPYVRVFGNEYVEGVERDAMLAHIARGLRQLGDYAHGKGVTVLIESHGDFTDSPSLRAILERADSPGVALLWDAHHTFVSGKEEPEETVRQLGRYIRHTHLKDSVAAGSDRRYVLTGTGEVPVRRQGAGAGFSDGASCALGLGLANGDLLTRVLAFSPGFIPPSDTPAHGRPEFFVSHGRQDSVLPVDTTSRVTVATLRRRGYRVRYEEFDGPHTVPPAVAEAGAQWLVR